MKNKVLDAIVVGTGFAGLCSAIKLKEAKSDFLVLEKDSGVGGVWRANTYPGAQCDVQSHLYSFSFEAYPFWSRTYGLQEEILKYLEMCSNKYGITPHIRFHTEVTSTTWDDSEQIWEVKTNKGDLFKTKTLFLAFGGLSQVSYPDIPGIEKFQGKLFHSARWNHSVDLSEKKVGVIGSAASAIQIVPAIASKVKELSIFQRTASWIIPKEDRPYSFLEQMAFRFLPGLQWLSRETIYWQLEWRAIAFVYAPFLMEQLQKRVEKHIHDSIKDPVLAKKVTPNYTLGCKRILLSNDFYPSIQRPNVSVITTGIQEIDEKGIVMKDGSKVSLDVIVTATGFKVSEDVVPFEVKGKNGLRLEEAWKNGPEAYLGTTIKGFPNLFLVVGPNTGLAHSSMVYMIEAQVNYIMKAIHYMKAKRIETLEVKPQIHDSYNEQIQERLEKSVWNRGGCASWYKTKSGKNISLWPGFTFEYRLKTEFFNPEDFLLQKVREKIAKKT